MVPTEKFKEEDSRAMDTSPNQLSEVEFERLLFAASQTNRNLQLLIGGKEAESSVPTGLLVDEASSPVKE